MSHPSQIDPALKSSSDKPFNLFFVGLLALVGGYFLIWGIDYTADHHLPIFLAASAFGLFMAFNIGGNDVANAFGTSVGAGTLTVKQALLVAAVFEVSGAVIAGGEVTQTIRKGIVDLSGFTVKPLDFIFIMMAALLAAALWLLFASRRGLPVSTTHSIIGGIVGSSIALGTILGGSDSALSLVHWGQIGSIAISWVLSPLLGGLVSYALLSLIKQHILRYNEQAESELEVIREEKREIKKQHKKDFERLSEIQKISYNSAMARDSHIFVDSDFSEEDIETDYYRKLYEVNERKNNLEATRALETWVPVIAALGGAVISSMLLFKGLKNIDLHLSTLNNFLIVGMVSASIWMATYIYARTLKNTSLSRSTFLMFSWMQVFTASGFAFSHGSNDIANAIGPFAAILDVLRTGVVGAEAAVPSVVMITFGVALVGGLWFVGKEVIQTVGHNLTQMHPASGFAAELAAAAVVMLASLLGLPVSSTHILIGAVLGIGLVNRQTNWSLMKPIGLAWIITLPAAGLLSAGCFLVLRQLF
ncbi:inorganic phosphate transporter [Gilvimarinus chinensis]|uniref:inorganic phosphate transporter n=1 Tax=Gilvimarinus chinensis TaxID=396005 RepID=UPI00037DA97D|nr:inorganic phosphate transporter [Gilvimarinus chinensis]